MQLSEIKHPDEDLYLGLTEVLCAVSAPVPSPGWAGWCSAPSAPGWVRGPVPAARWHACPPLTPGLCAVVQDCTPAVGCLAVCGESLVDILGWFPPKADARCLCGNRVKKMKGTGGVKEKLECSLHLTSYSFSDLDNRLGTSVNQRELLSSGGGKVASKELKNHGIGYSQHYSPRGITVRSHTPLHPTEVLWPPFHCL